MKPIIFISLLAANFSAILAICWRDYQVNKSTGTDVFQFEQAKDECEKRIPRDQECVMVYDFVPVKKGKE